MTDTAVVWFRRDLRVLDNPALQAAAGNGRRVVPLFVIDPALWASARVGPARRSYVRDALDDLDAALRERGTRLVVRRGDPVNIVPRVAAQACAGVVHHAGDHTPYAAARDRRVAAALERAGVAVEVHDGLLLHPPGSVTTGSGKFFRVFTPFHRAWQQRPIAAALGAPGALGDAGLAGEPPPARGSADTRTAAQVIAGGERAALRRLDRFWRTAAADYHHQRDRLAASGTSRLSADLHYGCLSPRTVWARLDRRSPGHRAFATELAWRDFYAHVMARWPQVRTTEFNPAYRGLPWRRDTQDLRAWQEGRTGYPIVDAGMRQLSGEAWMHNRARMLVASFLCKDLRIDWRLGEAHFLRALVDADLASNNGGWQWAAGTGTDAQPYYRVFNPVTQGERFDPDGNYVRRWVPELTAVPDRWIHHPWDMPDDVARACGVRLGTDYPYPIVDHAQARRETLAWFAQHRAS